MKKSERRASGHEKKEQARIVQLLVERVEIAEDGLDIRLRTNGLAGLVREFGVDARAAA